MRTLNNARVKGMDVVAERTAGARSAGARANARRLSTHASYVDRVNRAIDLMVAHLDRPVRLRELARAAALSAFHFHRVFQALTGQTPADFAKQMRLDRALGMMSEARKSSLTEIALACGFASSSDFSRSFKQRFGVAPSAFDLAAWRGERGRELDALSRGGSTPHVEKLPGRSNPDQFKVRIRDLPARTVAYIRIANPYKGGGVMCAVERLTAWATRQGLDRGQWLGYQWENPEITPLERCGYYVAVEAERFTPSGEIGRFRFPAMTVAQIDIDGGIELELRALRWLYGSWLPRSGYVPGDQPSFEAWVGLPFAHGVERFELGVQLPIRRGL
ncbi:MAG: helix-turn-helix domain-containing protein [Phycisphaerales bacterium]|nr:helix-turn-helix domain-containing protein [Phycisphaerales bacterium]